MEKLNFFSLVCAPTEVISTTGALLSHATSFFYKRNEKEVFLVTNWHVVTGRHPVSPQNSCTGAVPTRLRLTLHKNVGDRLISLSRKVSLDIEINDESGNAPEWLEHPDHHYNVDIVVIKIKNDEDFRSNVTCHCITEYTQFTDDFIPSVMNDVFVIGYPWGLTGGDRALPLYKRGSIASEPFVDYEKLPRFLIDCRTANAMSGAPVLCASSGIWAPFGKVERSAVIGTVETFAGVYSGRLRMKVADANVQLGDRVSEIGVVWKRTALDDIIARGVTGTKLNEL